MKKIKIVLNTQSARPGPPIGPILGQYGVDINSFCNEFNKKTLFFKKNIPVLVFLYINKNRKYTLKIKMTPVSDLLKNISKYGTISLKQIYEVAKLQQKVISKDIKIKSICKILIGTLKSMNISIYNDIS
jgi:large subunit ribosomal protein L11